MHRVLYVHHDPGIAGSSVSLLFLLERLDRKRYAPTILMNALPGAVDARFARLGIPVHHDPSISIYPHARHAYLTLRSLRPWEVVTVPAAIPGSARRFQRFLREHPHDLVHLNSAVQIPAGIGARRAGVPVVWHIREELHPGTLGLRFGMVRRCIDRCASAIVSISRQNASMMLRPERVDVVYNFVDFALFDRSLDQREARKALDLPHDRPIILMLGGVVPHKGADILVRAAAEVRRKRPDALFVVAGVPPGGEESASRAKRMLRRALESSGFVRNVGEEILDRIRRDGLESTVRFIGVTSEIPRLLAASDLLVWPATASHFSRPIIEAGAMARPVVSSDLPADRELVLDGETGLLSATGDPQSLATALLKILEDPSLARRLGEGGYRLARERYDGRRNAQRTFDVYARVLRG